MRIEYLGNRGYNTYNSRGFIVTCKNENAKKLSSYINWFCSEWELTLGVEDGKYDSEHRYFTIFGIKSKKNFDDFIRRAFKVNAKSIAGIHPND